MAPPRPLTALLAAMLLLSGCASPRSQTGHLSEDQILDMMAHPRRWDGRTISVQIYPSDNGFEQSYIVCFEPCDAAYAESSPFIVYTAPGRFRGFGGDRPVVIRARYDSSCCFSDPWQCVHHRFGRLYEIPPE